MKGTRRPEGPRHDVPTNKLSEKKKNGSYWEILDVLVKKRDNVLDGEILEVKGDVKNRAFGKVLWSLNGYEWCSYIDP